MGVDTWGVMMRRLAWVVVLGAWSLSTGCGGGAAPERAASSTTAAPSATAAEETTTTVVVPFGPLEGIPLVEIDAADLPEAPAGYIDEDIALLAAQAVTIATRGIGREVWTATPEDALDRLLAGLPPETLGTLEASLVEQFGKVTTWALADRFHPDDLPIGPPRVFARGWSAELNDAGDGTSFLVLELRLSLAYAFEPEIEPRVALVQRSVRVASFGPRDPANWPSVGGRTRADAIDRCALIVDGLLRPASVTATNIEHFMETIDPSSQQWGLAPDGSESSAVPAEGEC